MDINLLGADEETALGDLIRTANKAVIVSHINPDGDAVGSSLAWAEFLRSQGKEAVVVVPDQCPDFLRWMPGADGIIRCDKKPDEAKRQVAEADLLCCLDHNDTKRLGEQLGGMVEASAAKRLLIDHHPDPVTPADISVSRPQLSSTAETVFRLIWQLGGYDGMTCEAAADIYAGMMTDTGGFTYNSTRPEIYFIISQLLAKGIDKDRIYRNVYNVFSLDRLRMTGYVLYQKLCVLSPLKASYYAISKEEQKRFRFIKGDAEGLVNMPLQLKGHRLSISLREDTEKPNLIWVSLRSVDDFPCNEMAARFFNGGGHLNASGGRLYCSLKEAETVAREAIKAYADKL